MTDKINPLGRRGLIRGGAIGGAATLLAAAGAGSASAAVPAINDKDYADFSLIKINGGDDSLEKIQKKGVVVATSNDWPYSFLDDKTNEWTGLDGDILHIGRQDAEDRQGQGGDGDVRRHDPRPAGRPFRHRR